GFRGRSGRGVRLSFAPEMTDAVYHSRLLALDLETGKVVWERGGRAPLPTAERKGGKEDLADTYFLGPPLPAGGRGAGPAEREQEVSLVCLNGATGAVLWKQKLAVPQNNLLLDGPRRLHAALPAHADGVLVCPTNAGAVVAVELATRRLLWAHSYRKEPPP